MKKALQKITKFKNLQDCYKDLLKNKVKIPELQDRDDFIVEYKRNSLDCPKCGAKNATGGFFYKFYGSDEWVYKGGKPLECDKCSSEISWAEYKERTERERLDYINQRVEQEYYSVPENLKEAGFKNYQQLDNVTTKAKAAAVQYVKDFLEGNRYNLLMQGNPGTGKSHLSVAIARTIKAKDSDYIIGFITTGELLRKIKDTYSAGASRSEADIFKDLKLMDLLILDDLGSEAIGGNDDWRKGMLFEIINSRLGKPTIYTSNFTDDELPTAIGARSFSRLYDNTKFIDLFTDDYRKKLKIG